MKAMKKSPNVLFATLTPIVFMSMSPRTGIVLSEDETCGIL